MPFHHRFSLDTSPPLAHNPAMPFLSVTDFAAHFGISRTYVHQLIRAGRLEATKAGHNFIIDTSHAALWHWAQHGNAVRWYLERRDEPPRPRKNARANDLNTPLKPAVGTENPHDNPSAPIES